MPEEGGVIRNPFARPRLIVPSVTGTLTMAAEKVELALPVKFAISSAPLPGITPLTQLAAVFQLEAPVQIHVPSTGAAPANLEPHNPTTAANAMLAARFSLASSIARFL